MKAKAPNSLNKLYYGDNLDVLPQDILSDSVDLIYLDSPFCSNRTYSVLFNGCSGPIR
jgi:DNA modification methylase